MIILNKKTLLFFTLWILLSIWVLRIAAIHPREVPTWEDKVWIENELELIRHRTTKCNTWSENRIISNQGLTISTTISECSHASKVVREQLILNNWHLSPMAEGAHFCKDKYVAEIESSDLFVANLTIAVKYYRSDKNC